VATADIGDTAAVPPAENWNGVRVVELEARAAVALISPGWRPLAAGADGADPRDTWQ
jgi:hypothetical protein